MSSLNNNHTRAQSTGVNGTVRSNTAPRSRRLFPVDKESKHLQHAQPETPRHRISLYTDEKRKAEEKRLVRKFDLRILVLGIVMHVLNHMGRGCIATGKLGGLEQDLGLKGNQFAACIAVFYGGYVLMQIPTMLFLVSIRRPSILLSGCMIVWGAVTAATAASSSFAALFVSRLLLGVTGSCFAVCFRFYLSSWYTRTEFGLRVVLFNGAGLLSGAISGLISAAIINGLDKPEMRAWRWLFIIYGAAALLSGIIAMFVLPDYPQFGKEWLSDDDKALATMRLEQNPAVIPNAEAMEEGEITRTDLVKQALEGFSLAVQDIQVYLLVALSTSIAVASSVHNFYPTVMQGFNFNNTITMLLVTPPYLLSFVVITSLAKHSDSRAERALHIALPLLACLLGNIILLAVDKTVLGARYTAVMLLPLSSIGSLSFAWATDLIAVPRAKRATALAMISAAQSLTFAFTP